MDRRRAREVTNFRRMWFRTSTSSGRVNAQALTLSLLLLRLNYIQGSILTALRKFTLPWEKVETRADLIALRAEQIERRDQDVSDTIIRLQRLRAQNKEYHDSHRNLRIAPLKEKDLVLLHNTRLEDDITSRNKLRFR